MLVVQSQNGIIPAYLAAASGYNNISCAHPRVVGLRGLDNKGVLLTVGCGKCPLCLAKRRRELVLRLQLHNATSAAAFFITLTYRDDSQGCYRNVQLFLKRLRKDVDAHISYVCVQERGKRTGRYHHHLIVFSDKIIYFSDFARFVELNWPHGFVLTKPANDGALLYVAGYVLKKAYDLPIERAHWSRGLGYQWLLDHLDVVKERYCVPWRGLKYPIPRYLVKKIAMEDSAWMRSYYDYLARNAQGVDIDWREWYQNRAKLANEKLHFWRLKNNEVL